jgi:hypothetical protein
MKKSNYVTVNTDSTIESVNLSTINLPLEGYPLLLIMENLKEINKILEQKISKLKDATSGHKASTPASARKKKEMEKLEQEQNENKMRFNSLIPHVHEFADVCGQIDENYSTIIKSYYCDINKRPDKTKNKVNNDLQTEIDKYIDCTAHNFKVKLQTYWIYSLLKRK